MKIAALETATSDGSVALFHEGRVHERECELRGTGALASLEALLRETGVRPRELDALAVSVGPGSFTGARLGVAAAQGFGFATGCRLVPVGTLEAIAESVLTTDWGVQGALLLPLVDARRAEVYASVFRVLPGGRALETLWGPEAISCQRLAEFVVQFAPGEARVSTGVLCGDGAAFLAPFFADSDGWSAPSQLRRARAGAVARVAARRLAEGQWETPDSIQPVYLRKSDAEIARDQRQSSS